MPAALEGKRPLRSAQWLHNPHQPDPLEPLLSFPVKEMPISRVSCGRPGNLREACAVCLVGYTTRVVPLEPHDLVRQSGAQRLPVAPPTLSLALPSRVRLFLQSHLCLPTRSPTPRETTAHPQQNHSPAPWRWVALSSAPRPAGSQLSRPHPMVTAAGAQGLGCGSESFRKWLLCGGHCLVTMLRKGVKATSQLQPHT